MAYLIFVCICQILLLLLLYFKEVKIKKWLIAEQIVGLHNKIYLKSAIFLMENTLQCVNILAAELITVKTGNVFVHILARLYAQNFITSSDDFPFHNGGGKFYLYLKK